MEHLVHVTGVFVFYLMVLSSCYADINICGLKTVPSIHTCEVSWKICAGESDIESIQITLKYGSDSRLHTLPKDARTFSLRDLEQETTYGLDVKATNVNDSLSSTTSQNFKTLLPIPVHNVTLTCNLPTKTIATGDILRVECVTSASIPPSSVWWFIDDKNVTQKSNSTVISIDVGSVTESTLVLTVHKRYHRMRVVCIAQNMVRIKSISDTITLNVQYPPAVKVTIPPGEENEDSRTMRCSAAGGNPGRFNFTGWQHFYMGHYIRKFGGIGAMTSLTLRDLTYEDTGNYKCYVRTDIKRQDGTMVIAQGLDTLKIEAAPKFFLHQLEYTAILGSNLTVDVPFLVFSNAKPKSTEVIWTNLSDSSLLQNSLRLTQEIRLRKINVSMHSRYVMWDGYSAHLEFVQLMPSDFGSYNVLVRNTKGDINITITLKQGCSGDLLSLCGGLVYLLIGIGGLFVFVVIIGTICCIVGQRSAGSKNRGERSSKADGTLSALRGEADSQGYISPVTDGYLSPVIIQNDPNSQHLYDMPNPARRSENMYTSVTR